MKNNRKLPAWMKSHRPDTIYKNCLNVQEGLVEPCDFDPAMCQECETTACKWHPSKQVPGAQHGADEDEDDLEEQESKDEESEDEGDDRDEDERG
jgi:hypothetical protein